MTHGKTYNKSPRRINHKATKSKTNTKSPRFEEALANRIKLCFCLGFHRDSSNRVF